MRAFCFASKRSILIAMMKKAKTLFRKEKEVEFSTLGMLFLLLAAFLTIYIVQQILSGKELAWNFYVLVGVGCLLELYPIIFTIINIREIVLISKAKKNDQIKKARIKSVSKDGGRHIEIKTPSGEKEAFNRLIPLNLDVDKAEALYFLNGDKAILVDIIDNSR